MAIVACGVVGSVSLRFKTLFKDDSARPDAGIDRTILLPELQLVLACSHIQPRIQDKSAQAALIAAGIDWKCFLALVEKHRVAPVAWKNLKARTNLNIPEEVLANLEQAYQENAYYTLLQASELTKLVKLLDAESIRYMVLKGLPIALEFYGDLALRQAGDIDLLVGEGDLNRVRWILEQTGYRETTSERSLAGIQGYVHKKLLTHHIIYQHPSTRVIVELHWRLFTNPYLLPVDPFEAPQSRIPFGGVTVLSMADEDLLIYLCVHGDSHLWMRLKWQFDLPQFLEARPALDWHKIQQRAKQLGVSRALYTGLFLASCLCKADLPDDVMREIQADSSLVTRLKVVCNSLLADRFLAERLSIKELLISFRYLLGLRSGVRYKGFLWISRCFSAEDWRVLPLPDMLFFLYIPLRPFLIMIRLWRRHQIKA